jgi:uncharacterized membrane protein
MKTQKLLILLTCLMVSYGYAAPDVRESHTPTFNQEGSLIMIGVGLINYGSAMPGDNLLEVQTVQHGGALAWSFGPFNCDPNSPDNVDYGFQLNTGESKEFSFSISPGPGEWDFYVLTRSKCYAEPPTGNNPVAPYPTFKLIKAGVTIAGDVPLPPACDKCTTPGATKGCQCMTNGATVYAACKLCQTGGCYDSSPRIYEYCDQETGCNSLTGKCAVTTVTTTIPPINNGGGGGNVNIGGINFPLIGIVLVVLGIILIFSQKQTTTKK